MDSKTQEAALVGSLSFCFAAARIAIGDIAMIKGSDADNRLKKQKEAILKQNSFLKTTYKVITPPPGPE